MQREYFERALRDLEQAPSRRSAVCALDVIRPIARQSWFDAECADRIAQACERAGLTPPELALRKLAVGEAWLLLYVPGVRAGCVSRLLAKAQRNALDDNGVLNELERAYVGLSASLARSGRALPADLGPRSIEIDASQVEGASLGVAACVAWMSRAAGRAPRTDVAHSAEVRPDGTLGPVAHLDEKVAALIRSRPDVRRLVVAQGQSVSQKSSDLRVVFATSLEEALRLSELDPTVLPLVEEDSLHRELEEFKRIEQKELSTETWNKHATRALTVGQLLTNFGDDVQAQQCLRWGALFALHGGNPSMAEEILARLSALEPQDAEIAAWRAVLAASTRIDTNPIEAVQLAHDAHAACAAVERPRTRDELLARARGTFGRALVHAGRAEEGEAHLRDAIDMHERVAPREVPRSHCYLAQALRMQGRATDALSECERALELNRRRDQAYERKTALFLELERGRALLALGRAAEALQAFEATACAQLRDEDYPRIGALRGLAAAHRVLGNSERAGLCLERCIDVASRVDGPLRDVAAAAVGDALLEQTDLFGRDRLERLWTDWYHEAPEARACATRLRRAVY